MRPRAFLLLLAGLAGASFAAACGSSSAPTSSSSSNTVATTAATPTPATPTPASTTAAAAAGPLSGTWSGQYSGAYNGTFTLNWLEGTSTLSGTINLHPGGTMSVNGTVNGSTIQFGTVGAQAITYSGTVSGNSRSSWPTAHRAAPGAPPRPPDQLTACLRKPSTGPGLPGSIPLSPRGRARVRTAEASVELARRPRRSVSATTSPEIAPGNLSIGLGYRTSTRSMSRSP